MAKKKAPDPFNAKESALVIGGSTAGLGGLMAEDELQTRERSALYRAEEHSRRAHVAKNHADWLERQATHLGTNARSLAKKDFTNPAVIDAQEEQNLRKGLKYAENALEHNKTGQAEAEMALGQLKKAKGYRAGRWGALAVSATGTAAIGSAFYMRHRRGKLEKVRKPNRSRTGM